MSLAFHIVVVILLGILGLVGMFTLFLDLAYGAGQGVCMKTCQQQKALEKQKETVSSPDEPQLPKQVTVPEINKIQTDLRKVLDKLDEIVIKIEKKKIEVDTLEKAIDDRRDDLRKIQDKKTDSFESHKAVDDAEKAITKAINDHKKAKNELITLMNTESSLIEQSKLLQDKITIGEIRRVDLKRYKGVGIYISDVCKSLIQNNFTTNCPRYDHPLLLSLDTSNKLISGDFVTKNGWFHRDSPKYQNSWRYYENSDNKYPILIDPPVGMQMIIITIESNLDVYRLTKDKEVTNYSQTLYKDRYVAEGCNSAVISADVWEQQLADTIFYIRNGCDERYTKFKNSFQVPIQTVKHDYTTSQKYKEDQWKKQVLDECTKSYGSCKNMTQPVR